MSYVSLYRKYRSQTFDQVVGQEHITRTLQNAIRLGKVAHAYLFCGTRGTGKTTTARLLAKALNCEKGPTAEPCNECDACQSITQGSAIDIIELDAASHRGVGDVKEIRDNVKFPPMALRYKVFIIDEAHQLSNDAKDAFLKTLEEPPPYVVFVLATTEPHNIPVTIRSRCQQFDFRRGSLADIRSRLKYVVEAEGIDADDEALDLISINADGSYRDSLSLLEQVLAYTDKRVTVDDVYRILGTVTRDFLFRVADVVADGDEAAAFAIAAEAAESGKDLRQLLRSLAEHFRNLLFAAATRSQLPSADSENARKLREQASKFDRRALPDIVQAFADAEREARFTDYHTLILEMTLLRAITIAADRGASKAGQPQQAGPTTAAGAATTPGRSAPLKSSKSSTSADSAAIERATPAVESEARQSLPDLAVVKGKWNLVLQTVKTMSMPAHSLIINCTPVGVRDGGLVLQFRYPGQMSLFRDEPDKGPKSPTRKRILQMALERVFGVPDVKLICEHVPNETEETKDADQKQPPLPDPFADPEDDTLRSVLDMFNGQIVDDQ